MPDTLARSKVSKALGSGSKSLSAKTGQRTNLKAVSGMMAHGVAYDTSTSAPHQNGTSAKTEGVDDAEWTGVAVTAASKEKETN